MSIAFDGTNRASRNEVPSQTAWVWSGWVRRDTAGAAGTFFSVDDQDWVNQSAVYRGGGGDGVESWRTGVGTHSVFEPMVSGTWYYFMLAYEGGNWRVRYLADGQTAWQSNYSAAGSALVPTHIGIGGRSDISSGVITVAMSKIWSGTLPDDTAVLAERLNIAVTNTTGIWASYDFLSGALDTDRSGNSRTLTLVDAPTYTADKPTDLTIGAINNHSFRTTNGTKPFSITNSPATGKRIVITN